MNLMNVCNDFSRQCHELYRLVFYSDLPDQLPLWLAGRHQACKKFDPECHRYNSSVQFSHSVECPTLCDPMDCSTPGFPVHHQLPELLKLMSIESVMPSNHLILCHPLLLLSSIFPSIRVFSNESVLRIRWPKFLSFSFSISPSNEYSGLISFKIDWLDLLAVQGTLKSLLQHHSSKASIPWHSALFIVQLSLLEKPQF